MSMIGVLQKPSSLLAECTVFQSDDLDETRHHIGELFVPHSLKITGKRQSMDANIRHVEFAPFTFVYIKHGADVDIDPGKLKDFFMIQIPLSGNAEVQVDGQNISCSMERAAMLSPTLSTTMQFQKECEHLNIRIEKNDLESFLEQQLSYCLSKPLQFLPEVSLENKYSQEFLHFISFLALHLNQPDTIYQMPIIRKQLSEVLMNMFLINLRHNYHELLCEETQILKPAYIRKAQAYIDENAHESIAPSDIAKMIGTSPRTLYAGFKRYLGTTPMAYLRSMRLDKTYKALQIADPLGKTVSEIALEYGFVHLGHFSKSFKNRFGEMPSQILKK